MKQLDYYILEKLKINSKSKINQHKLSYFPKDKDELEKIVDKLIKERGENGDLNDIDTSEITDMSKLFAYSDFNGDISNWDVSNVRDMSHMFFESEFTGENGDISNWNVSNVILMNRMFAHSKFNGDISKWNVNKEVYLSGMFDCCFLKNEPKWYK